MIPLMTNYCNCFVLESSAHKEQPPGHVCPLELISYIPLRPTPEQGILFLTGENVIMVGFYVAFYGFLRASQFTSLNVPVVKDPPLPYNCDHIFATIKDRSL